MSYEWSFGQLWHRMWWITTNLEKRAQCNVWKVVVCPVPATFLIWLLPKVQELLLQLADRTKIQDVVSRYLIIQCRIIYMWQQPDKWICRNLIQLHRWYRQVCSSTAQKVQSLLYSFICTQSAQDEISTVCTKHYWNVNEISNWSVTRYTIVLMGIFVHLMP